MKRFAALILAAILCMSVVSVASAQTFRKGAFGSAVLKIQQYLNTAGYGDITENGKYGDATYNAVVLFQKNNKLKADGIVGPKTMKAMFGVTSLENHPGIDGVLRVGYTGPTVRAAQTRLKNLGYNVKPDGVYGKQTQLAVVAFQKNNGLYPDGAIGPATMTKLYDSSAIGVPHVKIYRTLRRGSSGGEVKTLQTKLKALGYYSGNITGYYNADTELAVILFQRDNGLTDDGVAGQKTLSKLYGT